MNARDSRPVHEAALPFGDHGELRQAVGTSGRVHLDRSLPFLVLNRATEPATSLARRVAVNSPAYLVWGPDDDAAAAATLDNLIEASSRRSSPLLLITLEDQPLSPLSKKAPRLPPFVARLTATPGPAAARAADRLERALRDIRIDLRRCKVERSEDTDEHGDRITLALPQIHREPGGDSYPQMTHDLSVAFGDALLQAACAFVDDGKRTAPAHYRSLGRSAFLAAALSADRKLGRVARSFDFLLSISPINTAEAMTRFLEADGKELPHFRYRPLSVDPDSVKRTLYNIDLSVLEDPLLERLLTEKRRELDQQLTMLATRNTPAFRPASTMVYGSVEPGLLADALSLLAITDKGPPRGAAVAAPQVADAARSLIAAYRALDERFDAKVEIRDDVSGLMVTGPKLLVGSDSVMPAHRLDALLAHEVSVHLLTFFNGASQGLTIFRTGLANYEGVQEGLGVFAEWAVDGLTRTRLRLLAGRVVAVDAMLRGADFIETWQLLHRTHGFRKSGAFGIAARVHRSGGLAKDAIYLRGFRAVVDLVASGASLLPFWLGKIAPDHAPAIEELLQRGLVREPVFIPEFFARPDTRARMARLRSGLEFQAMFDPELA
ncbi:MAG TPA: tyrosine/phenylalanine carboxypeptidase domain-containing protein [Sphingomicrobium sp.]|nr:tyrosine/phenylalanine carboxypeptidase domain-containing protein [Sphingomicrobium sp.]